MPGAWQRAPGSARRYRNARTGEELSRRQYDERYGRLARTGQRFTYEQMAQARSRAGMRGTFERAKYRALVADYKLARIEKGDRRFYRVGSRIHMKGMDVRQAPGFKRILADLRSGSQRRLDRALRALGRRTGKELWPAGETPVEVSLEGLFPAA